jgi:hypothetical protein
MALRVSIVLPAYNAAAYIRDALASVAGQTCDGWELIVVDDGSTDQTAEVVSLAPGGERRRLIQQPNLGLAAARNAGLAWAQAELVAFLDADDRWQPGYLEQMCRALDRAPQAAAAFAGWQYMDADGQPLPQTVVISAAEAARLDHDLQWRNALVPSAVVARRAAIRQAGGFDEALSACADWDLWLTLLTIGPLVPVRQPLVLYRAHAGSMSADVPNMERERLMVHAKHLGPASAAPADWPPMRRQATGYTYFNSALAYLRLGDRASAARKVLQAVTCWPGLLELDEFYYELAASGQPRGLRGHAAALNLSASEALLRSVLSEWLPPDQSPRDRRRWRGRASLALARLAQATGQRRAARRYALRAIWSGDAAGKTWAARTLVRSTLPGRRRRAQTPPVTDRPATDRGQSS